MIAEFSEIQYMFGAVREIEDIMTNGGYHSIIPLFPTQPQEKNAGYLINHIESGNCLR